MSTIQTIGLGAAANDKTGDSLRTAGGKINQNFANLNADKAEKTNVLEKNNTTAFTPTANYHPATKKYTDDAVKPAGRTKTEAFTLTLTDAGGAVVIDSIDDIAVTIPPDSEVNFPVWTRITLAKIGLGNGVYVAGEGVTMTGNPATATGKWATAMKVAADTWVLSGEEHVLTWVDLLAGLKADENYSEVYVENFTFDNGKIVVSAYSVLQDRYVLLLSEDSGATWADITPEYGTDFYKYALSGNNIVVDAYEEVGGHKLLISDDLGDTWSDVTPEYGEEFTCIIILGYKIVALAYETVNESQIYKVMYSENLGASWLDISPEYGEVYNSCSISANNVLVIAYEGGESGGYKLMASDDAGATWSDITPDYGAEFGRMALSGNNIVISAYEEVGGPKLLMSDDLGDTWSDISIDATTSYITPCIVDNTILSTLFKGEEYQIYMSVNNGETFKEQLAVVDDNMIIQANNFVDILTIVLPS